MLGQYLRGQLLVMLILAVYYSVGLALFGFSLAVPVGVFTGPGDVHSLSRLRPRPGAGAARRRAAVQRRYGVIAVAVVYGVGQVFEGFFLTPRLVGERIGLNPLAVIFALLAFGHLFGFVGVLVALPAERRARCRGAPRCTRLYRASALVPTR